MDLIGGCCRVIHHKRLDQWPQPRLQHGGIFETSVLESAGQELRTQGVLKSQQFGIERPTGGQELPRLGLQVLPLLDEFGFSSPCLGNVLRHEIPCGLKLR